MWAGLAIATVAARAEGFLGVHYLELSFFAFLSLHIKEMEKLCEQLDIVLLEVMSTLQELSQLREQYSAAVREVSTVFSVCIQVGHEPHSIKKVVYGVHPNT